MAKLPEIQPRGAVTRGPQSSVTPAEVADPYRQIAQAFNAFGQVAAAKEADDARISGQAATYRDDSGNLQVDLRPNWTEKDRTYNRYASQSFAAQAEMDAKAALQKVQQDAKGNPDTFKAGAKAFRDQFMSTVPRDLRGPIGQMLDSEIAMGTSGVMDQKYRADMSMAKSTLTESIAMKQDEMAALARQGGTGTDAYKQRQSEIRTLWGELTADPIFQISQKEADLKIQQSEARDTAEALLGEADRALQTGGVAAAQSLSDRILTDEKLALSPAERRQYAGMINEAARGYRAEQRANLEPLKDKGKERKKLWEQGAGFNDPSDDDLFNEMARNGGLAEAQELKVYRATQQQIADAKRLGDKEQVGALERATGTANQPAPTAARPVAVSPDLSGRMQQAMQHYIGRGLSPVMAAGIVGNLVQESALNTSARNRGDGRDGSDSIGIGQWNGARGRALQAFAKERGADPSDFGTQLDFVLHELETTEGAAFQRLKAATNVDEATAAMIGFERPSGWSTDNPRGGHGWNNRYSMAVKAAEMQGLKGEVLGVTQRASVAPEVVKTLQTEVEKDLTQNKDEWKQQLLRGNVPDADSLSLLQRQLALVDNQNLRQEYADIFKQSDAFQKAYASDPAAAESFISSLETEARSGSASLAELQVIDAYKNGAKASEAAWKADPLGTGTKLGLIPPSAPFDPGRPESFGPVMAQAQSSIRLLQADGRVGNISALRPEQEKQVAQVFAGGDPKQMQALTDSLGALSPQTLKATMSSDGYKLAIKGAALSNDPIRFNQAMAQLDMLSETASWPEIEASFGNDTADRLQDWQTRARYFTPDEAKAWLRERNAPDWQTRVKPAVDAGKKDARKDSFDSAMGKVAGGWFTIDPSAPVDPMMKEEFLRDYVDLVGARNGSLNDVGAAKDNAAERMRGKWGATSIFGGMGGRLMLYPPERSYPEVDGSHDWLRSELEREVATPRGLNLDNLSLVADQKTEASVQRGELPGYLISVINPDTGARDLLTDDQGRPMRYAFDPKAATAAAMEKARTARETANDPWLMISRDTSIGPLYPGGATPEQLQQRQQRIDQLATEQEQRMEQKRAVREQLRNADIPGLPGGGK